MVFKLVKMLNHPVYQWISLGFFPFYFLCIKSKKKTCQFKDLKIFEKKIKIFHNKYH